MRRLLLALAALLLFATSAQAAIYFAGGEDTALLGYDDHNASYLPAVDTGAGDFRSNFAREALEVGYSLPYNRLQTPPFAGGSVSSFWASGELYPAGSLRVGGTGAPLGKFYSSDGVLRLSVTENASSNGLALYSWNAAGTSTLLATESILNIPVVTLSRIDFYVNYTCSVAGEVQVWIAGVKALDFTGNPCTDSNTALDWAAFCDPTGSEFGDHSFWSEIIVASTSTQSMNLLTLAPNGAGAQCAWSLACALGNIGEAQINDAAFNATSTVSQIQEFTVPTTVPSGNWSVLGICEDIRGERGGTGPQNIAPLIRTAGADYTLPNVSPLTAFNSIPFNCWFTNPATSGVWTITDITNGLQIGAESEP